MNWRGQGRLGRGVYSRAGMAKGDAPEEGAERDT